MQALTEHWAPYRSLGGLAKSSVLEARRSQTSALYRGVVYVERRGREHGLIRFQRERKRDTGYLGVYNESYRKIT